MEMDPDAPPVRVKVVRFRGKDGFVVRFTTTCSGCTPGYEESGGGGHERGMGCYECGYTGKSRHLEWVPLPKLAKQPSPAPIVSAVAQRSAS